MLRSLRALALQGSWEGVGGEGLGDCGARSAGQGGGAVAPCSPSRAHLHAPTPPHRPAKLPATEWEAGPSGWRVAGAHTPRWCDRVIGPPPACPPSWARHSKGGGCTCTPPPWSARKAAATRAGRGSGRGGARRRWLGAPTLAAQALRHRPPQQRYASSAPCAFHYILDRRGGVGGWVASRAT